MELAFEPIHLHFYPEYTPPIIIHTIVEPSKNGPKEIGLTANVLLEGSDQRIDLALGKPHDEYEKKINEYIKF